LLSPDGEQSVCYVVSSTPRRLLPACPQCAQLLKRIVELEALVRDLQERLIRNSSDSSSPLRPIRWTPPSRWSRPRAGANQVVSPDILDIIAIAFRPSGLRISCPTCPRSAPSAKLRCLPSLDLATPTRAGVRLPNSPSWRRSSPSTKDTHLSLLWLPQSWPDSPGDPRPRHRATLGRGNVLLQRPSSSWPTGCERGRRDRLRGADLPGLHLRAGS